MFDRTPELYDAFYDAMGKDYPAEAAAVASRIHARLPGASTLLDVACGTGRHLEQLAGTFTGTGVDLDGALLAVARSRCPDLRFVEADMCGLDLGERFDAVTCLFSSIGYVGSVERLRRAVAAMATHLVPGGVLVVEPWFQPGEWSVGHVSGLYVDRPSLKAARLCVSDRRDDVAVLDFEYLFATPGGVEHRTEHHELTLFTWEQYRDAFEAAGLLTELEPGGLIGRGLVLGVAPR